MKISHPITKNPIITLEDWRSFANPSHWVDGYSAKETAKFWLMQKEIPLEIFKRLNQIETMESIVFENLIPELQTTFDQYSNGRNHDMGVFAKAGNKKIFIGIESKVAEPFDNKTLGQYLNLGLMDRWLGIFTKKPDRAEGLFSMFKDFKRIANIFDIKYQLLQSTAGIIAEAHKNDCDMAVFLVHQFKRKPKDNLESEVLNLAYKNNFHDWCNYLKFLGENKVEEHGIYGPFFLNDTDNMHISSYIPFYLTYIKESEPLNYECK